VRPAGVRQTSTPGFRLVKVPTLSLLGVMVMVAERSMSAFPDIPAELVKHHLVAARA